MQPFQKLLVLFASLLSLLFSSCVFHTHQRALDMAQVHPARALYAYPMAGMLWLGLEVPATVLGHLPSAPLLPWMYPVD